MLADTTTPGLSGPGSNGIKRVLILRCSLVSYPGHLIGEYYPSGGIQSVYSTVLTELKITFLVCVYVYIYIYIHTQKLLAQLARAVEYTNCISAQVSDHYHQRVS